MASNLSPVDRVGDSTKVEPSDVRQTQPILQSLQPQPIAPLGPYHAIGFDLTKRFSWILAGYLLFAICSVVYSEHRALSSLEKLTAHFIDGVQNQSSSGPILKREEAESLVKTVYQPYRDAQISTIEFNRTVIINVLFPLLTALLGYIFAKGERDGGG